jgi:hypothetical protein
VEEIVPVHGRGKLQTPGEGNYKHQTPNFKETSNFKPQ